MKKYTILTILILISFVKTALSQTNQQPPKEKQYSISLPLSAWQIVFKGLGKLTAEESREIMNYIESQITAQNTPPPIPKPKTDSTQNKKKP